MQGNPFQNRDPNIENNDRIRTPQREAYAELVNFVARSEEREIGIVLPVGCGKSGCITLTPFAFKATRTLVIAPSVPIADQLQKDFDPSRPDGTPRKLLDISKLTALGWNAHTPLVVGLKRSYADFLARTGEQGVGKAAV